MAGPIDDSMLIAQLDPDDPGPIDNSVLHDQEKHVSSAVWEGQERGPLRCHEHTSKLGEWRLTKKQIQLVDKAGFGYLRHMPSISLDNPLISALVERWRTETNTFHFTVGEMTVTLKDVALLLGLPIDGDPVLGVTYTSCKHVCDRFLGRLPDSSYVSGGMVKLSWLKDNFSTCSEGAPLEEVERKTRAYLLYLSGSTIFSTTTGNKVPVMYLPLFEDFDRAGNYAWGAAALAFLYRALGKASLKSQSTISGCLTMLQCWSYYHLNIGRPKLREDPAYDHFPFVLGWKGKQCGAMAKHDIVFYRNALDSLKPGDVEWLPYRNFDRLIIPETISRSLILGRSSTMLICFDKAERHLPDRCMRQHGLLQGIPKDVPSWERKSRGVDSGVDLSGKMEMELKEWNDRQLNIVKGDDGMSESEYMEWYMRITRKFVGRAVPPFSPYSRTVRFRTKKKRMTAGLRDIALLADTFPTEGLDPQQIASIFRIRETAHYCLGDRVGGGVIPQIEYQENSEGNANKKKKSGGRCRRKDDMTHVYEAYKDGQSQFCGATIGGEELQQCHNDSKVEAGKPRKKQRVRRKIIGQYKKVDQSQLCYYEFEEANPEVSELDQFLPCQVNGAGDDIELYLAASRIRDDGNTDLLEPYQAVDEGGDA